MLTSNQHKYLAILKDGPTSSNDVARLLTNSLHPFGTRVVFTNEQVHAAMRRLEDRELVRRAFTNPIRWELTKEGRKVVGD